MHPIPILIIMQIAVDVGLIIVMLWTLLGVACSFFVAKDGIDVIPVVVFGLQV